MNVYKSSWTRKIIRSDEYIFLLCKPYYTNTGLPLFIAIFFYIMILAPLCTYYAFKGRNIPENFNETKYIGFSMYILLLSSIAYYPVTFVMIENLYVALVFCLTTLATSFGLSGCMFAHRVYILLSYVPGKTRLNTSGRRCRVSPLAAGTRIVPKPVNAGIPNPALKSENGRA